MFGFLRSPANKPSDEYNAKKTHQPAKRANSEPVLIIQENSFDDDVSDTHKNGFHDSGGLENQSVQDLENYAKYKAEETTSVVNNCLKLAEDIRQDAKKTLDMLHTQGEQINRTHMMTFDTEKDLSKGERLLNNLGGIFSKPWKPKKTRQITGPVIIADDPLKKTENQKEQREKLCLGGKRGHSAPTTPPSKPTSALQKVELEKANQDEALSNLSNILGDLNGMAIDMGSEIERQNKALDNLSDDADELNSRVKGANQRARYFLGK